MSTDDKFSSAAAISGFSGRINSDVKARLNALVVLMQAVLRVAIS